MTTRRPPATQQHAGPEPDPKPMTARSALIFVMAVLTGLGAGVLLWLATLSLPLAVLAGCGAVPAAWRFYDAIIA